MAKIPEYNQIDPENDSLTVIRAKLETIAKGLRQRALDHELEEEEIAEILDLPLSKI